jgi:alpha-galactosidase
VAPFVAEKDSHVFQQHPDWFLKDTDGSPLRSDTVTFGGWRRGPWYVLDGTHPDVQAHFVNVFSTMRREWGVTYFKLDANFWGAIHGGRFHDPNATRIVAYRSGMHAILSGAGDSFILGCNHPIWPSAGLIHGSRSSNDIKRTWDRIKTTAQQNLLRNWQNGRLWWNDPDAVCLAGDLPEHEFLFHATAIYATGGMVLSGDDLSTMPDARMAMLRKLLPPQACRGVRRRHLRIGTVMLPGRRMVCCSTGPTRRHADAVGAAGSPISTASGRPHAPVHLETCRLRRGCWSARMSRAIVAVTSFVALFSIVGLALYGLPFYYDFMVKEFGWSRAGDVGNAISNC